MKVKWLWAAFVSVLIVTTFGVTIPATAKLHAVVEDSTTLVILDSDSTEVFRKEYPFVVQISEEGFHICENEDRPTAVLFHYEARDTAMVNPLPKAYTHDAYKNLKRSFWRSHLLVIGKQGEELLSCDMRWHKIFCNSLVFPDENTLFVFYFDTGELIKVDLPTKQRTTIALSDWGCRAFWDEEGPSGMVEAFPGNRVALVRSSHTEDRSEVMLLSDAGKALWKNDTHGVQRHILAIGWENRLVVTARIHWSSEDGRVRGSQEIEAINEFGKAVWTVPLGGVVIGYVKAEGGEILVRIRAPRNREENGSPPWSTLEVDPRTGTVREAE